VTSGGSVYHTKDGGKSWSEHSIIGRRTPPILWADIFGFQSLYFVDGQTGWIAGYGGRVYSTNDAGGLEIPAAGEKYTPAHFHLNQPYPNPFNPSTTIRYDLPEAGHVALTIYDILGRRVAVAADSWQEAGMHDVVWSAADVPSGIYFVRMVSGAFSQVRKMVLLR